MCDLYTVFGNNILFQPPRILNLYKKSTVPHTFVASPMLCFENLKVGFIVLTFTIASRKHAYINNVDPNTPLIYSKTGVCRGIHYFSYFC